MRGMAWFDVQGVLENLRQADPHLFSSRATLLECRGDVSLQPDKHLRLNLLDAGIPQQQP